MSSAMSNRKTKGRGLTKKRAHRATSNVFAMFDQAQIQEFKEAFNMIDQNRDGLIDKEDLQEMLGSLGKNPGDAYLDGMMNEAPGPINFTMFLTLFGERLQGTDPEDVIKNAFACFDEDNAGVLSEERLRELLTTIGDRFTDEDVSAALYSFFLVAFIANTDSNRLLHIDSRWTKCIVKLRSTRTECSTTLNSLAF